MNYLPFYADADRPSACCASPAVLEDIQRAIKSSHALSAADVRLAARMGLVVADVERPVGLNDGVIYPRSALQLDAAPATRPLRAARMARATGQPQKLHVAAFLVDFSDNKSQRRAAEFQRLLFDPGNPDSFINYYHDLSHGMLEITGEAIGWIRAPQPYAHYTAGTAGLGRFPNNAAGLMVDVLTEYCKTDNLARFDADGDGFVDGIFLIHAGGGAEAEPDGNKRMNMIWSHQSVMPLPYDNRGVFAYAYTAEPEDGKLGVFVHEFGHVLGLPDLYDTSYRSLGVGDWCLMGSGSWSGGGDRPTRLSCWCLSKLGWIEPISAESGNYVLEPLAAKAGHCLRVWTGGKSGAEYFMLENRQATGRDSALQGSGLAVWHIDETMGDNANPPRLMVGLVQSNGNPGEPVGDVLFPGALGRSNFSALTRPLSSHAHDGAPTGVSLSKIAVIDGKVTVAVKR